MHQNVVALHAANGMLDKDADLTQGCIGSLLFIAQWRVRVLFALARLLRRDVNLSTLVVRWNTKIASIDPNMDSGTPIPLRRKLLFHQGVIVMVTATRTPEKDYQLVRERHHRIRQRRLFFSTVMLTLFGIICCTMIGTFGGINAETIHTVQRRFQLLRGRQRALGHQLEMHQGIVQNRRELRKMFVGCRARHLPWRCEPIKGGIRLGVREDTLQCISHRWQCKPRHDILVTSGNLS